LKVHTEPRAQSRSETHAKLRIAYVKASKLGFDSLESHRQLLTMQ
jgi:hypothetical protein